MKKTAKFSLGVRFSLIQTVIVFVVMGIFTLTISSLITRRIEQRAEKDITQQVMLLVNSMSVYHAALAENVDKSVAVFRSYFTGAFALDQAKQVAIGNKQAPTLTAGSEVLTLNNDIPDRFTAITKSVATIFARTGDDFIRVATSLKKEDGSRAIGTLLDRNHPAYQGLLKGEQYIGKATLFGKDYITKYLPIKDGQARVIAVLFIGLDYSESFAIFKEQIRSLKIGRTGYLYAMDASDGKNRGVFTIHPTLEGKIQ